jgi:hypothetical protein
MSSQSYDAFVQPDAYVAVATRRYLSAARMIRPLSIEERELSETWMFVGYP